MKPIKKAWLAISVVALIVGGPGNAIAESGTADALTGIAAESTSESVNATATESADAAAPKFDSSASPLGWTEYLPLEGQVLPASKITLSYKPVWLAPESSGPTAPDPIKTESTVSDSNTSNSTTSGSGTSDPTSGKSDGTRAVLLKRHEIQYPTIYAGPRTTPQVSFEKYLFDANLAYMLAVNVADFFTTRAALKHPELVEANPLMQPFVKNDAVFASVKAGLTLGSYFIMKNLFKKNKPLAWVASIAANAALSYVVFNNLRMIRSVQPGGGSL